MPSPDSLPDSVRVSESTQHRAHAHHVEPLVPAESHDHGSKRRRRGSGHVAEAEVLPEGVVVAGEAAPETADTGGDTEGRTVQSFKDFPEDVDVVVYAKLGSFLFLFWFAFAFLRVFMVVHHFKLRHRDSSFFMAK